MRVLLIVFGLAMIFVAPILYLQLPVDGLKAAVPSVLRPDAARPSAPETKRPPISVEVASAAAEDVPIYLTGIGTVQAYNTVNVRSRVDGEIAKILFQEGQDVSAGDPLAIIDPRPYAAQLHQQEAMRRNHQAQLDQAIIDLQRYEKLVRKDFAVSQQQVDQQRALVEQDRALVDNDEAQIEYAKTQLDYTTIRAPISGRVGIRMIDLGNIVRATDNASILVITQLQPISVIFTLSANAVAHARLAPGQTGVAVTALGFDNKLELDHGQVDMIDNQVDQTTGTIKLKASFPNKRLRLWPGDFVNGRITIDTRKGGLTVPMAALRHGPTSDYVWVARPDKTAELRPVVAGQVFASRVLVERGLKGDEQVVTEGHYRLENHARIEIVKSDTMVSQSDTK